MGDPGSEILGNSERPAHPGLHLPAVRGERQKQHLQPHWPATERLSPGTLSRERGPSPRQAAYGSSAVLFTR